MKKYTNATDNSNHIMPGGLFISMPAAKAQEYLDDAVARGAIAVMIPMDSALVVPANVHVIKSGNISLDAARVAAEYYPEIPKHICAVTGTKGKTSTVAFVRQIMQMLGKSSATIGTLGLVSDKWNSNGLNTTPRSFQLRQWLSRLAADEIEYLAMEASSIGLEEQRMEFIAFDSVGFSNLAPEHLGYHGDMENYFKSKKRLFTDFEYGVAVLNADDEYAMRIPSHGKVITFGRTGADMKIKEMVATAGGQRIGLDYFGQSMTLTTTLIGEFQVYNVLMAIGLVIGMGFAPSEIPVERIFAELRAPRGRAEYVGRAQSGGCVYVDYAHTAESLESILIAMRAQTAGKLHLVFGCGGGRDIQKRSRMGLAADKHADEIIVTDDNPRFDDPAEIRSHIIVACPRAIEIGDRETAIKTAIEKLSNKDVLIIAGKGHETEQIVGNSKTHFDDAEIARKYLAEKQR
ncbi:MAG: UDP-N-acetylmuramoyl-L-alanyl-D-glutamate--2,6-diaminopimelate ligase [Alphaproteobacteria bacterium]|nr:UDP-N-acetylmuramoyl-L-alanyl-D-glutamate--2,6-diaminopimelate ligase [Alphaproteobacteria bacterium]